MVRSPLLDCGKDRLQCAAALGRGIDDAGFLLSHHHAGDEPIVLQFLQMLSQYFRRDSSRQPFQFTESLGLARKLKVQDQSLPFAADEGEG